MVLNSLLGLFVFVALMITIMHLFRSKRLREQMKIIAPILEALQTIARGNFDVQIEHDYRGHEVELFSELVTGVNSMAQQLKQMEEMRQEFISNVSHEIQSPLTSIRGFAQALQNEQLSTSERSHYLAIIETESTRLSKLSDNLLSLAALDAKTVQPDCKAFRLDKQIRGLILACEPQWSAKQIDMTLTADEILFSGDENLLSQVWVNLLHNTIKFTSDNGSIGVALHGCQDAVEFRIADSGIGIAPAAQERLFERFFKADTAAIALWTAAVWGWPLPSKWLSCTAAKSAWRARWGRAQRLLCSCRLFDYRAVGLRMVDFRELPPKSSYRFQTELTLGRSPSDPTPDPAAGWVVRRFCAFPSSHKSRAHGAPPQVGAWYPPLLEPKQRRAERATAPRPGQCRLAQSTGHPTRSAAHPLWGPRRKNR
ncbi:MAG: HAMP domain-containing sensor histidine kinase [Caldilineaceae bacterium]